MPKISILTDNTRRITKSILNENLDKGAYEHIVKGHGETIDINLSDLPDIVRNLTQHQCVCLGAVKGLDYYEIDIKDEEKVSRTTEWFNWIDGPAFIEFDFDGVDKLTIADSVALLRRIDPSLENVGMIGIPSCSSYLYAGDKQLSNGASWHLYLVVTDGSLTKEYCDILFNRLILEGEAWSKVDARGAIHIKTPLDNTSWRNANREIFEAMPVCCEGVTSKRLDFIEIFPGKELDIVQSVSNLSLSQEEMVRIGTIKNFLRSDPETVKISETNRAKQREKRAKEIAKKKDTNWRRELKNLPDYSGNEWIDPSGTHHTFLEASAVIKDNNGNDLKVQDILEDPAKYEGWGLPDVADPYTRGSKANNIVGRDIARVRYDSNESVRIYSFKNSVDYHLIWDFETIINKINDSNKLDELNEFLDMLQDSSILNHCLTEKELNDVAGAYSNRCKNMSDYRPGSVNVRSVAKNLKESISQNALEYNNIVKKEIPEHINRLNAIYGAVMIGGKARIVQEKYTENYIGHYYKREWRPQYINIDEFKKHNKDEFIFQSSGGKIKKVNIFADWEESPYHNKYTDIVFKPTKDVIKKVGYNEHIIQQGGVYNMWQGFLVDDDKVGRGNCERILWHIRNIWCSGKGEMYEYVLAWLASLFQEPGTPGHTFLVLQSVQGAGKNIITDQLIGGLLGTHATTTGRKSDIIGKFNAMSGTNVFTCINEAFFAGDKKESSIIKTLTDPSKIIELKGVDSVQDVNRTKYIFASNDDWVSNVEAGDRRFVYPMVSNEKARESEYFKELGMAIENGGREAFLEFMLKFNNKINLHNMPDGQSEQKLHDFINSADTTVRFLYDLCTNGYEQYIGEIEGWDIEKEFRGWSDTVGIEFPKPLFVDLVMRFSDKYKLDRRYKSPIQMFKSLASADLYAGKSVDVATRKEYVIHDNDNNSPGYPTLVIFPREEILKKIVSISMGENFSKRFIRRFGN